MIRKSLSVFGLIFTSILLMAASCGDPPPSLTVLASALTVEQGGNASTSVSLNHTGLTGEISLSVTGAPAGVTASISPNPTTAATTSLSVEVANSVAPGNYTLVVTALAGSLSDSANLSLTVTPPPVSIDSVAIVDYNASKQVRQGSSISLEVLGKELAGISIAKLGDLTGFVNTNNNISATIFFSIPHGEDLGGLKLSLTANAGLVSYDDAVIVTEITIDPAGDDTTGKGTPDSPFKTISKGMSEADSGDSIKIADGTYSQAEGESFPITVKDNVSVLGTSEAGSKIEGNAGLTCLIFAGSSTVSDLSLSGCFDGIYVSTGTISLSRVTSQNNTADGMDIAGDAVATVSNASFKDNGSDGLDISGTSDTTVSSSSFTGNNFDGLIMKNSSNVSLSDSTFSNNSANGIDMNSTGSLDVVGGSVNNNGGLAADSGIWIHKQGAVSLDGMLVDNNGLNGVHFLPAGGGSLRLRNMQLTGNGDHGFRVAGTPASVDLGTSAEPGNNTFTGNTSYQLADERTVLGSVIEAVGVNVGGAGAQPTGLKTGVGSEGNRWQITLAGNQINFGP